MTVAFLKNSLAVCYDAQMSDLFGEFLTGRGNRDKGTSPEGGGIRVHFMSKYSSSYSSHINALKVTFLIYKILNYGSILKFLSWSLQ